MGFNLKPLPDNLKFIDKVQAPYQAGKKDSIEKV